MKLKTVVIALVFFQIPSLTAGFFTARAGPRTFPQNVQDERFEVNLISYDNGGSEPLNIESDLESVRTTSSDGKKLTCFLPQVKGKNDAENETISEKSTSVLKRSNPEAHLDSMLDLGCFYRVEGWWIYELCYKNRLRQYHVENEKIAAEFILGFYDSDATLDLHEKGSELFLLVDPTSPAASKRYHAHLYSNGTECDLTGEMRTTEVRYLCQPGAQSFISSIKEESTCHYVLIFHTNLLCNLPGFQEEKDNVNDIDCYYDVNDPHEHLELEDKGRETDAESGITNEAEVVKGTDGAAEERENVDL